MFGGKPTSTTTAPVKKKFEYKAEQLEIKSRQKTPLTLNGFEGFVATREKDKPIRISHAAGPIYAHTQQTPISMSYLNPNVEYEPEVIANWVPQLNLSVFDPEVMRPLSAAEIGNKMSTQKFVPHYFLNPMQDLDYITIEALLRFTFVGPLMDALVKFIVGTGFRPQLELLNPSNDKDKNEKAIQENQDIIDALVQIDNQIGVDPNGYMDTTFPQKIASLISVANGFNRSSLFFGYETPIEVNNVKYKQIPSSLKFGHARDLGIIDVDPGTHRLKAVQWRNAYNMVPARDMIYLWNPIISAKTRNSWLYGDSMIMPMIDASRIIRKNIGVNFPAMAEATWSGLFLMAVKPQAQESSEKQKEYDDIASRMVRGGPNILLEDPNEVKFQNVDFNPKVNEFVNMTEFLIKYCVANTGLPHTMFYDESAANRATMLGKLQLAKSTVIEPMRAWISEMISPQWHQRWFRLLYKDGAKKDLLKTFKIKMAFSDLQIEQWFDKVNAVNMLDGRRQLSDAAYGDMIGVPNYKSLVEPNTPVIPGGKGGVSFNINREENNI